MAQRASQAATSPIRRRIMQGNRRRDTGPELALRRALYALGYRYRVDYRASPQLRRRVDIAFTKQKLAVFMDGCFWHSCPQHGSVPKTNMDYWIPKLARNVDLDQETDKVLRNEGWIVVRVWEHENPSIAASRIADILRH